MQITIERKYKKNGYTIGNLYIDSTQPLCNTLEPTDRGLVNNSRPGYLASKEWQEASQASVAAKHKYGKGKVAIPTGTYRVVMEISSTFRARRAFLRDVPGFEGIMIHEGNTMKDTQGCILVGRNTIKATVTDSRKWLGEINSRIIKAISQGEKVMLTVR